MRARDAENMMAEILTRDSAGSELPGAVSRSDLIGLYRSRPIYARKLMEKEGIKQERRYLIYRRALTWIAFPIKTLMRVLKLY